VFRRHAPDLAADIYLDNPVERHSLLKRFENAHPSTSPSMRNASSATSTSKTSGRCERKRRSYSKSASTSAPESTISRRRDRSSRRARNTSSHSELVLYNVSGAITLRSFHRVVGAVAGTALFLLLREGEQPTNRFLAGALVHVIAAAHEYGGWPLLAHHPSYWRTAKNFRARYICYKFGEVGLASRRGGWWGVQAGPETLGRAAKR
jgi:hypothetical protein